MQRKNMYGLRETTLNLLSHIKDEWLSQSSDSFPRPLCHSGIHHCNYDHELKKLNQD